MSDESSDTRAEAEDDAVAPPPLIAPRPGLYLCSRSSHSGERPCDGAFLARVVCVDYRTVSDPKHILANRGTDGDWYTRGTNHRVVLGMIARDLGEKEVWAVEIADVHAFVAEHGLCILGLNFDGFWTIEIYDDYRE